MPLTYLNPKHNLSFDLRVNVCLGSAMDYISNKFAVDSSSRFPSEHGQTHRHTNSDATENLTHTTDVGRVGYKVSRTKFVFFLLLIKYIELGL